MPPDPVALRRHLPRGQAAGLGPAPRPVTGTSSGSRTGPDLGVSAEAAE
ncbi:hypothetical protein MTF65_16265 [Streptomyces sp. APSN-46.1]|nr:hypothetical protein [Streptomyces sp. APSN-46.1]MCJ1678862.1 hypothetical protein [Streptomyces sp. APSN-46.1]